jgi:hypothetical protein
LGVTNLEKAVRPFTILPKGDTKAKGPVPNQNAAYAVTVNPQQQPIQ